MFRRDVRLALLSLTLGLAGSALAPLSAAFALDGLDVDTSTGKHHFEVEIAKDEASREKGLMFRKYLPEDRGMLFEFDTEEPVDFWMKNTPLSLDIIFIDHAGVVKSIAANAEPLSETTLPSGAPVDGVLELLGGEAAKIGLMPGDRVEHPFFKK